MGGIETGVPDSVPPAVFCLSQIRNGTLEQQPRRFTVSVLSSHKQQRSSVPGTVRRWESGPFHCGLFVICWSLFVFLSTTAALQSPNQPRLNSHSPTIASQKNSISRFQGPLKSPYTDLNTLIKMSPAFSRAWTHELALLHWKKKGEPQRRTWHSWCGRRFVAAVTGL